MTLDEFSLAGLATGLTALLGELGTSTSLPAAESASIRRHIDEQRDQVRRRVERFQALQERVIEALAGADVPAVFVKGAELIDGVWPHPLARPMADLDVVVPRHLRAQAGAALVAAGCAWWTSTAYEDAFLGWGDGSTGRLGRRIGRSQRARRGPSRLARVRPRLRSDRVRRHRCGATPSTAGSACRSRHSPRTWWGTSVPRWSVPRYARSMSSTPGSATDAASTGATCPRLLDRADPRLAAPGLWLVDRLIPGMVPDAVVAAQMQRLPARRKPCWTPPSRTRCSGTPPHGPRSVGVKRSPIGPRERVQVVEQMVWPSPRRSFGATVERVAALGRGTRLAS